MKESIMEEHLLARLRFTDIMTRFATFPDRGEAIKGLHLCTADFKIGPEDGLMPKGRLANMLMLRQIMPHRTKHHVGQPTIISFTPDRICGTAPIASYRMEEGHPPSVGVSEFYAEIIPTPDDDDGEPWKIQRLRMLPFRNIVAVEEK